MTEYHKIQTVFKRDPDNRHKTLLDGEWSMPEFEFLADVEWLFTEKVDGTNIRIDFDGHNVEFKGRTDAAMIPKPLRDCLSHHFGTVKFADLFPGGVTLYGEGYGPKIQSGGKYRSDPGFVLFDVLCGDLWLQRDDVVKVSETLDIEVVPTIGSGSLQDMVELAKSKFNSEWGNFTAEGIVARPVVELKTRRGERIITKIKAKDFVSTSP